MNVCKLAGIFHNKNNLHKTLNDWGTIDTQKFQAEVIKPTSLIAQISSPTNLVLLNVIQGLHFFMRLTALKFKVGKLVASSHQTNHKALLVQTNAQLFCKQQMPVFT
jgi:hypothetical protein